MKKKNTPPPSPIQNVVNIVARVIVGGILIYAGFSKVTGPVGEFAVAIDVYRILPTSFVLEVARILPWVELYAGLFILFGYFLKANVKFATALFGVFILVFLLSLLRGIDPASCGCFGEGLNLTLPQAILADSVLFGFAFYLIKKPSQFLTLDRWIRKGN